MIGLTFWGPSYMVVAFAILGGFLSVFPSAISRIVSLFQERRSIGTFLTFQKLDGLLIKINLNPKHDQ